MELAPHVEALQRDLAAIAAVGDDATAQAAQRLSVAIRASTGLRLLDALGEVALELNAQLPSGRVEVRLAGQDPSLVYVDEGGAAPPASDEGATARITLRLTESLKAGIEAAAAREGVSVNTWLVRALGRSISTTTVHVPEGRRFGIFRDSVEVRITVRCPEGARLTARAASGDVRAHGRLAGLDVATASGDVEVDEVDGEVRAKTASGDVRLGRIAGDACVRTAS